MRRVAHSKKEAPAAVIGAGVILLLCLGVLLLKSTAPPAAASLLNRALAKLEQAEAYSLAIVEKGPGFNLYFKGQMENGTTLTGSIQEFKLDILYTEGVLNIKAMGTENWEEAGHVELEALKSFLVSPLEILHSQKKQFSNAVPGAAITLAEALCKTAYWEIGKDEALVRQLFPEINYDTITAVSLGAALAEPDLKLKQLRIVVQFNSGMEQQLERAYYLDF